MSDPSELEKQLLRAREGDRGALTGLLAHYRPELERSAMRQLGPAASGEGKIATVIDEVFAQLTREFPGFQGETQVEFAAWLSQRLYVHTSSIRGRSRGPSAKPNDETDLDIAVPVSAPHPGAARPGAASAKPPAEIRPEDETHFDLLAPSADTAHPARGARRVAIPSEQAGRVLPLVRQLPQPQQRVVRLRYLDGWPLVEIAAAENEPPAAIVGRLRLAMHTLKVLAARHPPEVKTWVPEARDAELAVDQLLAEYLSEIDAGRGTAQDKFVSRHPEHAAALADFFAAESEWLRILDAAAPTMSPDDPRAAALPPPPRLAEAPRSFGEYEILETIARGGMGVVYKAVQKKLQRVVALKMILAGQFARPTDVKRFQAEAEAVAKLRHQHIVPIHEVGEHQGHHYYSMDYIAGHSLADEIRKGPLPPVRAAELVALLAAAMDYAHREGVVHRDLKPANILLDTSGTPHITDFGLAKRSDIDQGLTATGAVLGTPNYMPPEQAAGRQDEIGARSDVYSLGAVLYDMLTGRPPFQAATSADVLNQVLLHDPVPPRTLNPHVPADLETIVDKCLRKDPAQRYASARDLQDDLTRFLTGEPINARPLSAVERSVDWCRRNPTLAAFGGIAVAACVVALVVGAVGYWNTSRALTRAEESQRQADESFRDAKGAVDRFFVRVSNDDLLRQPGLEPLRRDLLREADRYYRRLLDQRAGDPGLREELALTRMRVGQLTEELESPHAAIEWYQQASDALLQLALEPPEDAARISHAGDAANALAVALHRDGQYDAAREAYAGALKSRERAAQLAPDNVDAQRKVPNTHMNLGLLEKDQGHVQEALTLLDKAQTMRAALLAKHDDAALRRDTAQGYYNLANLAIDVDDRKTAEENLAAALPLFDRLVKDDPANRADRHRRALCRRLLADLKSTSDPEAALNLYQQARGDLESLALDHPDVIDYHAELAKLWMNIGQLQRDRDLPAAALTAFEEAEKILEPLATDLPELLEVNFDWAKTLAAQGELKRAANDAAGAKADLEAAQQLLDALVTAAPMHKEYQAEQQRIAKLLEMP